jgi:hypothetical protein
MDIMDWVSKLRTRRFVAIALPVIVLSSSVLDAGSVLDEDFDGFASDTAVEAAGWRFIDENGPVDDAIWTISNSGSRANPPDATGAPTSGRSLISDSDWGGSGANQNPGGSGMSHDVWSPSFDASELSRDWLHLDVSALLNNNGQSASTATERSTCRTPWLCSVISSCLVMPTILESNA